MTKTVVRFHNIPGEPENKRKIKKIISFKITNNNNNRINKRDNNSNGNNKG